MARREKLVTITSAGRDKSKQFLLTEMPADQAERWATRAILAIASAGGRLPDGVLDADGMAGLEVSFRNVVVLGLQALQGLNYREIEPLLDEMKPCIRYQPPGGVPLQDLFPGENSQIEEVATWYTLRFELLQLHLGFSLAGVLSTSGTTPGTPPAS